MPQPLPEIQKLPKTRASSKGHQELKRHVMNGVVAGFVVIALLAVAVGISFWKNPAYVLSFFVPKKGEILQDPVITSVALTREVSALGSPVAPVTGYFVKDKKYFLTVQVQDATPNTDISVRWYEGKVLIGETSKIVEGSQWISFSFEPATPHATAYRLEISRDGVRKTSVLFTVQP